MHANSCLLLSLFQPLRRCVSEAARLHANLVQQPSPAPASQAQSTRWSCYSEADFISSIPSSQSTPRPARAPATLRTAPHRCRPPRSALCRRAWESPMHAAAWGVLCTPLRLRVPRASGLCPGGARLVLYGHGGGAGRAPWIRSGHGCNVHSSNSSSLKSKSAKTPSLRVPDLESISPAGSAVDQVPWPWPEAPVSRLGQLLRQLRADSVPANSPWVRLAHPTVRVRPEHTVTVTRTCKVTRTAEARPAAPGAASLAARSHGVTESPRRVGRGGTFKFAAGRLGSKTAGSDWDGSRPPAAPPGRCLFVSDSP